MRGHRDLRLAVAAAALCALLATILPFAPLRLLFAAPLALFLPGYAIAAAAFARHPLERLHQVVLSLGLSLAVLALGALVLNYVPDGIRTWSWAVLLFLVVLGACRGAALARPAPRGKPSAWSRPRLSRLGTALTASGCIAFIAAIVLAFVPVSATHAIGYTELWILPVGNGAQGQVRIGVGSREQEQTSYRLNVRFEHHRPEMRSLTLAPGQTRVLRFAGKSGGARREKVSAILFRTSQPNIPYRHVWTWVGQAKEP